MHKPKPHVIILAYYFPPSSEIGARRPARFYKWLQRLGYRCHVVTTMPQPGDCPANISVIPDELHDLWEKGVGPRHSFKTYLELLVRHLMFPGHMGIAWSRKAAAECERIVDDHPNEEFVLFVTYPPLGTLLAGLEVRRRKGLRWIADFRDPLSALMLEGERWYVRFWGAVLEQRVFRSASAMIANTEPASAVWRERYPWARQKVHVLYNGYDPEDSLHPRPVPPRDHKLLLHAGTFYHGRTPNLVIEAMARLRRQSVPEACSAKMLLLGTTSDFAGADRELYDAAQRDGWLELRPPVPRSEAETIIEEADAMLLFQGHSTLQVPGKLYEYICVGRPVLALLRRPSPVEPILERCGIAHVCIYTDDPPEAVDRKLVEFLRLSNTPAPINDWFQANFNSQFQTEKLASIIDWIGAEPGITRG